VEFSQKLFPVFILIALSTTTVCGH